MLCVEIARVEDSPFEYRSPRTTVLLHRARSWMCDLTDGPDEAHQLTSDSDSGDGRAFAAAGHSMELAIETQIAFFSDVDHLLRLIFAPPPDDGAVADSPVVLPGRLHGDVPDVGVAGLGDGEPVGRIAGTRLPRHQADRCDQLRRRGETPQIADRLASQIRYHDQRQHVAGTQILPELRCIAPVRLDALARLARRQRRRRDITLQTRFGEPPIQLVAARTSFVHDPNLATQL